MVIMDESWQQKLDEVFEERINEIDTDEELRKNLTLSPEKVKARLRTSVEHMKYVAKTALDLIELDKQKGYYQYRGVDPEIVWVAAIIHDLGDLEEGNPGYDHMAKKEKGIHLTKCEEHARKLLSDVNYRKNTDRILYIIRSHDIEGILAQDSSPEMTAIVEADRLWRYEPDRFPQNAEYVKETLGKTPEQMLEKLEEEIDQPEKRFGLKTRVAQEIAGPNLKIIKKTYFPNGSYIFTK